MASFSARLYKAITGTDAAIVDTPFTEIATTPFARDDIARILRTRHHNGNLTYHYSPEDNVTRAHMAIFLAKLYEAIPDPN